MTTTFPFDRSPAFQTFLQTIDAAQCRGMSEDTMEDLLDATLTRLDQQWETLEQLAHMGLEAPLTALLDVLLREWSVKEALALLLREAGTYVDPTDAGLQTAFWDKLARQHQVLSSELLVPLETGKRERAAATAQAQPTAWETLALDQAQRQHQQQQDWQGAAFQLLREQHASWRDTHQIAEQWSSAALDSVYQAQQGVQQMSSFAAHVHANVTSMLATTQQQQGVQVEEAVQRAHGRQIMNRLLLVGAILLFIFGAFGCVFFAASHLLLR